MNQSAKVDVDWQGKQAELEGPDTWEIERAFSQLLLHEVGTYQGTLIEALGRGLSFEQSLEELSRGVAEKMTGDAGNAQRVRQLMETHLYALGALLEEMRPEPRSQGPSVGT